MEPQIRFCTSADGTRIAYATYGSGPPLVYANNYVVSVDAQLSIPEARVFYDALAARTTLVIFDRRGAGASTREVDDLSPEAEARDIAAVAESAGLGEFTLFSDVAAPMCAQYAIEHLDRIQRLILWAPWTGAGSEGDRRGAREFRKDWSLARRVWAGRVFPEGPVSLQRAFSWAVKETLSVEIAVRRFGSPDVDLGVLLSSVTVPTLVLQRELSTAEERAARSRGFGGMRQSAITATGLLQSGHLQFVPGTANAPYPGHEPIVEAVLGFMNIVPATRSALEGGVLGSTARTGVTVILFADIVDSTVLTERLGDAAFRDKARDLDAALRKVIRDNGGTPIEGKLLGDGVLATFASAKQAIEAALACGRAGEDVGLPLHLGLHAGDVIREEGNVFGGAVNITARVSALSGPGEVLVSDTVRSLARTSAGVSFEDRGEQALKGVGEAVRVFRVHWRE